MRIAVLLVQSSALLDNLGYFVLTRLNSFVIRRERVLARYRSFRRVRGGAFGVEVVRQDCEDLPRMLGGELVPELVNALLGRLLLDRQPRSRYRSKSFSNHTRSSRLRSGDVDEIVRGYLRCHGHSQAVAEGLRGLGCCGWRLGSIAGLMFINKYPSKDDGTFSPQL